MWSFVLGIVALLFVYGVVERHQGVLLGVIVALAVIIIPLLKRVARMQRQVEDLQSALKSVRERLPADKSLSEHPQTPAEALQGDAALDQAASASVSKYEYEYEYEPEYEAQEEAQAEASAQVSTQVPTQAVRPQNAATIYTNANANNRATQSTVLDDLAQRAFQAVMAYFTDGNIFVRIGIIVMFFGVAFLLKYAAQSEAIPLALRFFGAGALGLVILMVGWRLRRSRRVYALLLQGAGIGITYITIFAAFRLAQLLPQGFAFALLVSFSIATVLLALLQNAKHLAFFALAGGFLAPLLVSTGQGNYIALFSYYTGLNLVVFALAWFRAWRSLNVLGFCFTFLVFGLWTLFKYESHHLLPATSFLLVFFLMYSLIGVLYAVRQPERMTGLVDGMLVFGTPVVVSGLLILMFKGFDYGIAAVSAALGFYYIVLARLTWRRVDPALKLLAEALLAIGAVFATLAIPYTLSGHWSSATWALEGAGILWVSLRQGRQYAQYFAMALQLGAGVLFVFSAADAEVVGTYAGGVVIATGGFISARLLYLQDAAKVQRQFHGIFFSWGLLWWFWSAHAAIDHFEWARVPMMIVVVVVTAVVMTVLDRVRHWDWQPASITAACLLPALVFFAFSTSGRHGHVLHGPAGLVWLLALWLCYWVIVKLEQAPWQWGRNVVIASHTGFVCLVAVLGSLELVWGVSFYLAGYGEGFQALAALLPLVAFRLACLVRFPAQHRWGEALTTALVLSLGGGLALWSLVANATNTGDPAPLPYVPFLNPLDLLHLAFFGFVLRALVGASPVVVLKRVALRPVFGGLVFVWLTAVLLRSQHHYLDIAFQAQALARDMRVHMGLSILWTVLGMITMWVASKHVERRAWMAGAGLVTVVLVKMFFVDLGASGTVERIITCLVVGAMLMSTGYFAPNASAMLGEGRA